jgi:hypothetical protein
MLDNQSESARIADLLNLPVITDEEAKELELIAMSNYNNFVSNAKENSYTKEEILKYFDCETIPDWLITIEGKYPKIQFVEHEDLLPNLQQVIELFRKYEFSDLSIYSFLITKSKKAAYSKLSLVDICNDIGVLTMEITALAYP